MLHPELGHVEYIERQICTLVHFCTLWNSRGHAAEVGHLEYVENRRVYIGLLF